MASNGLYLRSRPWLGARRDGLQWTAHAWDPRRLLRGGEWGFSDVLFGGGGGGGEGVYHIPTAGVDGGGCGRGS